jgi:hypothetical protein
MNSIDLARAMARVATAFGVVVLLCGPQPAAAGKPPGIVPDPDIVYLSDGGKEAVWQTAVRAIDLADNGVSGRDVSLLKSLAGRMSTSVAWSPDGKLAAWLELGNGMVSTPVSIVVWAPGQKPYKVFTSVAGDGNPALASDADTLAWGPACDGNGDMLVFLSSSPAGIFGIRFVDNQPVGEPVQMSTDDAGLTARAFAFSPAGQYLAFAGSGDYLGYGIAVLPMCSPPRTPFQIAPRSAFGPVGVHFTYMDWSRDGARLALSMFMTDNQWREMKIVETDYALDSTTGIENVTGYLGVTAVALPDEFGGASSEHSPSWGPITSDSCQRIAFSRSTDAGRSLYVLKVPVNGAESCDPSAPQLINAKAPRALDWK